MAPRNSGALYVRNFPLDLLEALDVKAAREGVYKRDLVIEAITLILSTPTKKPRKG
jgi:plasmid stability protein